REKLHPCLLKCHQSLLRLIRPRSAPRRSQGLNSFHLVFPCRAIQRRGCLVPRRTGKGNRQEFAMKHELPPLTYAMNALEPHISAETLQYHYGRHHPPYVTNLSKLIEETEFADMPLEEVVKKSTGAIFNSAARVWNHTFC